MYKLSLAKDATPKGTKVPEGEDENKGRKKVLTMTFESGSI